MDIGNLKQCRHGHGIHHIHKPGPLPLKGFLVDRLIGRGVSEVGHFPMPTWVRVGPEIGLCYICSSSLKLQRQIAPDFILQKGQNGFESYLLEEDGTITTLRLAI